MKKYFVLILLLITFYLPSHAELSDTIWTHPITGEVKNVKFSLDGKYIYAGNNSQITKIDAVTNQEIYKISIPTTLTGMDLSQDGKYIVFVYDTLVKVYNAETKEELKTFILPMLSGNNRYSSIPAVVGLSISFDNKYLGAVCSGGNINPSPKDRAQSNIVIWNFETEKEIFNNIESEYYYNLFSFSPTENKYAIGYLYPLSSKKVPINLYEAGTWKLLKQFEGHIDALDGIKFSKNGNYLASWSAYDTINVIRIWDIKNKTLKQNLNVFKYLITDIWDLCFLNDSTLITSARTLINLDKQTKSIIDDINIGSSLLDIPQINNQNLLIAGNYKGLTLYELDKTLDVSPISSNTNITLFPNPVTKELNISLENANNIIVNYRIINSVGIEVIKNSLPVQNNVLKINVSNLINGSYLLNLQLNNIIKSFNFIIQ